MESDCNIFSQLDLRQDFDQKTLFLPVLARAWESKKPIPVLIDTLAMEMVEKVNCDFSVLASSTSEMTRLAWIGRSLRFDRLIKDFIRRFPGATIVNIGCGLDTTYERIDNSVIMWYDLDLPEVIKLRKLYMNETINRKFISSSFLDNNWYKYLTYSDHILFIAGEVFYYYEQKVIRTFFNRLSMRFPTSELLFDVKSPAGVWITNRELLKTGTKEENLLKWGLKNTDTILSWSPRLKFLGKYYIYKQEGITMSLKNRILGFISDTLEIQYIVHFKIRFDYKWIGKSKKSSIFCICV
jgi:O-methyltransferase involved in polyketide biosynthesis